MCLITHGKSNLIRSTLLDTPNLIDEIYAQNSDGLGFMYNSTRGVRVYKCLPKNAAEARAAVAMFPQDDRELAVHWRWRTHGAIDKDNCHPYPVDGGGYLIHNGVLEEGNKADPTRSDTYHYIKKYLSGGLMEHVAHEPAFLKLITDHIGYGNKFVLMTSDGRMSIAGKHRGIELGGMWWSNTYAWDPKTLDPTYIDPDDRAKSYAVGSYVGNWPQSTAHSSHQSGWYADDDDEEDSAATWAEVLTSCDADTIAEILNDAPCIELRCLFALGWGMEAYSANKLDAKHQELLNMVLGQQAGSLAAECRAGFTHHIADVLSYYIAWTIPTSAYDEADVADSPNAAYAG